MKRKVTRPTLAEFENIVRRLIKKQIKLNEGFVSQNTGTVGMNFSPSMGMIDFTNSIHMTSSVMPIEPPLGSTIYTIKDESASSNYQTNVEYGKTYLLKRRSTGEYYMGGNISTPDTTMVRKQAKVISGENIKNMSDRIINNWEAILVSECNICHKTGGLI